MWRETERAKVYGDIVGVLVRTMGIAPADIHGSAAIEEDLGISGVDVDDLLEAILALYPIDFSHVDGQRYWHGEGVPSFDGLVRAWRYAIWVVRRDAISERRYRNACVVWTVTVDDLVTSAWTGLWTVAEEVRAAS